MRRCMCIFCSECGVHERGVLSISAYAGVYVSHVFLTSSYTFAYTLAAACAHAFVCTVCSSALGNEVGEVELVYEEHHLLGVGDHI